MSLIIGTDASETIIGTGGDDTIIGAAGSDFIEGGGSFNIAAYWTSPFGIVVRLFANTVDNDGFGSTDTLSNISGIAGTGFDDLIYGNDLGNYIQGFSGNDTVYGLGGNEIIRVGEGDDFVDGGAGVDRIYFLGQRSEYIVTPITDGFVITDTVAGRYGTDTVLNVEEFQFSNTRLSAADLANPNAPGDGIPYPLPAAANVIRGGDGNDILRGTSGDDQIEGGAGRDTLVSTELRREVSITGNPAVSATYAGPNGVDVLLSIETFRFPDGWLSFDPQSTIGAVVRLYEATLARGPDPIGLGTWTAAIESGASSLQQVAQGFVGSPEFGQRYGALDNAAFVTLLYQNVLGRAPDPAGFATWTGLLGSNQLSRSEVVIGFSESPEFIGKTAGRFASGVWAPDPVAVEVMRYYETVLDRLPDANGLSNWIASRNGGMSLDQMAGGFTQSPEFQQRYGALSNQGFVEQLYLNALDRVGDPAGIGTWTGLLNSGTATRADVVEGFAFSTEMTAKLAPSVSDGVFFI
jgi:Ca2+-binding RTX toxin-like protein